MSNQEKKSWGVAVLLAFFLGGLGIHKFYVGEFRAGILYLLFSWTFVPAFLAFIEFLVWLFSKKGFNEKYNS